MSIVPIGIDLAKHVFAAHGVDESGKPALVHRSVLRARLLELIASLPPCLIGMEACSDLPPTCRTRRPQVDPEESVTVFRAFDRSTLERGKRQLNAW